MTPRHRFGLATQVAGTVAVFGTVGYWLTHPTANPYLMFGALALGSLTVLAGATAVAADLPDELFSVNRCVDCGIRLTPAFETFRCVDCEAAVLVGGEGK